MDVEDEGTKPYERPQHRVDAGSVTAFPRTHVAAQTSCSVHTDSDLT